jgi:restriction system protein
MANVRKFLSRSKWPRYVPRTSQQAFETIERAELAMKKLFFDEQLTDDELQALLASDYLNPSLEDSSALRSAQVSPLYEPSKFGLAIASPFLFKSVEREILAYFGRHPELLFSLPPRKFEELIASVFRQSGFDVELTPETRDGGIDIIAIRKDGLVGNGLHLIECKRYLPHNTVGIGVVQRLLGVVEQHKATKGVIVTTSGFSRDACVVAESAKHRLALNEYSKVAAWLATVTAPAT